MTLKKISFNEPIENLSIIAAADINGVIGNRNKLPWGKVDGDLLRFKRITNGKTLIMGRKTYESLPCVLPNRKHVVVTTDSYLLSSQWEEGVVFVDSLEGALEEAPLDKDECFVIGGGEIFRQIFPIVSKIYLTEVNQECIGDVKVPELTVGSDLLSTFNIVRQEMILKTTDLKLGTTKKTKSHTYINYVR